MKAGSLVAVVVMGEIARSPRMINHARELAANGFAVVMVGYRGRPFDMPAGVRVVGLEGGRGADRGVSGLRFLWGAGSRMLRLSAELYRALVRERPAAILVQCPPSFPTLTAARWAARRVGARMIVDWHNYGFSLLALRMGREHWFVRLARWYEFAAGRGADRHFCVSAAMKADLALHGVAAEVLYDRPSGMARGSGERAARRLVAVCPAGWTSDEDLELLLDAAELLSDSVPVTVMITGDGEKRRSLAWRLSALRAKGVVRDTGFLPEAEYWELLRQADVGVSVHRSSSGLDLAMKVVDLFDAGVPVCALDYGGSVGEQIEEGRTGFLFREPGALAALLTRLASNPELVREMRRQVRERWALGWSEEWSRVALPVLEDVA